MREVAASEVLDRSRGWIASPAYDLLWFFGGAALALLLAALQLGAGLSVVAIFWGWTLLVDGPHIYATLSRTYLDREEWRRRRRLLLLTPLVVLAGPACLLLDVVTDTQTPFLLFLGAATVYGYLHLVRQHYGFLAIYRARGGEPYRPGDLRLERWCLYAGCWAPYAYFLLRMPVVHEHLGVPALPEPWGAALGGLALAVYAGALLLFAWQNLVVRRAEASPQKVAYGLVAMGLYGLGYLYVAAFEPVYPRPTTPDEALLLLAVVVALMHGWQYVGIVWLHNRRRYAEPRDYGPARRLSGSLVGYALTCAGFSALVYGTLAAATGTFPALRALEGRVLLGAGAGQVTVNQLMLGLWWGVALHHYLLDQVIWRVQGDDELRRHLGLA